MEIIDQVIQKHGTEQQALIPILLDIQNEYNYLPKETLAALAERMNLPLLRIVQVASFYRVFSLTPRGKHILTVCTGTACHVRGGERLLDQLQRDLDIEPGETTPDGLFTLEAVNCLGACALAPVMVVDGKAHGMMTASKVTKLLGTLGAKQEVEHESV